MTPREFWILFDHLHGDDAEAEPMNREALNDLIERIEGGEHP